MPISGWTKIEGGVRDSTDGDSAEAPRAARSEAHSDAVAAAGHQAAADDDARAGGAPESGDGREPDARGSPDRGRQPPEAAPTHRSSRSREDRRDKDETWDDADYEYFFGEYLDEGYRPRQPQEVKELPPIENTLSSKSSLADHLMWQLNLQTSDDVAARDRRGHHRQHRRRRLSGGVGRRDRGARRLGHRATSSGRSSTCRRSIRSASARATCRSACCCRFGTSAWPARRPRRSSAITCALLQNHRIPGARAALGIEPEEVKAHIEFIKHLDPKPGARYSPADSQYVIPDVYIIKTDEGYRRC